MEAEPQQPEPTTEAEMRADLADLAAAERRRASAPRHGAEWHEAVAAEERVRARIRAWIDER